MTLWEKLTLLGIGVLVAGLALALWRGSRSQQHALSQLSESLVRDCGPLGTAQVKLNELRDLPEPVSRYFTRVLLVNDHSA